ncbi:hypothetical protein ABKV19_027408 [Rosa sericea]
MAGSKSYAVVFCFRFVILEVDLANSFSIYVISGNIQNLGLIRLLNYIVNDIPKHAQKALFPGIWLTEVSVDSYKVPEFPENVKVSRFWIMKFCFNVVEYLCKKNTFWMS